MLHGGARAGRWIMGLPRLRRGATGSGPHLRMIAINVWIGFKSIFGNSGNGETLLLESGVALDSIVLRISWPPLLLVTQLCSICHWYHCQCFTLDSLPICSMQSHARVFSSSIWKDAPPWRLLSAHCSWHVHIRYSHSYLYICYVCYGRDRCDLEHLPEAWPEQGIRVV